MLKPPTTYVLYTKHTVLTELMPVIRPEILLLVPQVYEYLLRSTTKIEVPTDIWTIIFNPLKCNTKRVKLKVIIFNLGRES